MKDLALHILDIAQNSLKAKATNVCISITDSQKTNLYSIAIKDNGTGMDVETVRKVTDPYFTSRTTRKVGLGIPLFKQNAELTGGTLKIESALGIGTTLKCDFINNHIDRPSRGDIAGVYLILLVANPDINIELKYKSDFGEFNISTIAIKEQIEDIPINTQEVQKFIRDLINENLIELKAN